jgi:hypothetical protein
MPPRNDNDVVAMAAAGLARFALPGKQTVRCWEKGLHVRNRGDGHLGEDKIHGLISDLYKTGIDLELSNKQKIKQICPGSMEEQEFNVQRCAASDMLPQMTDEMKYSMRFVCITATHWTFAERCIWFGVQCNHSDHADAKGNCNMAHLESVKPSAAASIRSGNECVVLRWEIDTEEPRMLDALIQADNLKNGTFSVQHSLQLIRALERICHRQPRMDQEKLKLAVRDEFLRDEPHDVACRYGALFLFAARHGSSLSPLNKYNDHFVQGGRELTDSFITACGSLPVESGEVVRDLVLANLRAPPQCVRGGVCEYIRKEDVDKFFAGTKQSIDHIQARAETARFKEAYKSALQALPERILLQCEGKLASARIAFALQRPKKIKRVDFGPCAEFIVLSLEKHVDEEKRAAILADLPVLEPKEEPAIREATGTSSAVAKKKQQETGDEYVGEGSVARHVLTDRGFRPGTTIRVIGHPMLMDGGVVDGEPYGTIAAVRDEDIQIDLQLGGAINIALNSVEDAQSAMELAKLPRLTLDFLRWDNFTTRKAKKEDASFAKEVRWRSRMVLVCDQVERNEDGWYSAFGAETFRVSLKPFLGVFAARRISAHELVLAPPLHSYTYGKEGLKTPSGVSLYIGGGFIPKAASNWNEEKQEGYCNIFWAVRPEKKGEERIGDPNMEIRTRIYEVTAGAKQEDGKRGAEAPEQEDEEHSHESAPTARGVGIDLPYMTNTKDIDGAEETEQEDEEHPHESAPTARGVGIDLPYMTNTKDIAEGDELILASNVEHIFLPAEKEQKIIPKVARPTKKLKVSGCLD